jgi:hypothetical protein
MAHCGNPKSIEPADFKSPVPFAGSNAGGKLPERTFPYRRPPVTAKFRCGIRESGKLLETMAPTLTSESTTSIDSVPRSIAVA